jgi:DNA mismatch repair protein MutS
VHAGLAELAARRNYCLPKVGHGDEIAIVEGRHPVVESLSSEPFIPNDVFMDNRAERLLIITGPNMGGKSTYLRQTALIVLLAQMGSYVPATRAEIGVVDRIFTRVGASDHLARGQSTFMVEMTETANILNHATGKSLIILDEIGRGTSTFDGLSIAWATAEYIQDRNRIGAKTLFATHYHEMTELERTAEGVRNMHITVREWKNKIVFLRRIEKGAADQSYGIHVAQLAGLPGELIRRAREILKNLEKNELDTTGAPRLARKSKAAAETREMPMQLSLFGPEPSPILDELRDLSIDQLTPRQALDLLYRWKETL